MKLNLTSKGTLLGIGALRCQRKFHSEKHSTLLNKVFIVNNLDSVFYYTVCTRVFNSPNFTFNGATNNTINDAFTY